MQWAKYIAKVSYISNEIICLTEKGVAHFDVEKFCLNFFSGTVNVLKYGIVILVAYKIFT